MMNILHASLDISHVNIKIQIPMWAQAWPWMDGMMKDTYYLKNTKARCWLFFKATFIKSLTLFFWVVLLLLNGIFMDASHFAGIIAVCL